MSTGVLRVVTNLGTNDVTVTYSPTTAYYMLADGSAGDALQPIAAAIEGITGVSTVTWSTTGTGLSRRVNIAFTGTTVTSLDLQWAHANTTLDETLYGWTANTGNFAANTTSTQMPMGWVPLLRPVTVDSRPRQRRVGGGRRAISGLTRRSNFGLVRDARQLSATLLSQTVALDEFASASTPYATIESMCVRSLSLGYGLHYVPDETSLGTYSTLYLAPGDVGDDPNYGLERMDEVSILRWQWAMAFVQD